MACALCSTSITLTVLRPALGSSVVMSGRGVCRHGAQQAQRECSIPGPEDVSILDASPGPLAQGLAAAASESSLCLAMMTNIQIVSPGYCHQTANWVSPSHPEMDYIHFFTLVTRGMQVQLHSDRSHALWGSCTT